MGGNGKELLISALRHQDVPSVPWVPFAGVHAGKLKGYSAFEVLTEGDKLVDSLLEVNKLYAPDGQPIVFDLQIEAEVLGCQLLWSQVAPPSVVSHPLEKNLDIPQKLPEKTDGRIAMILDTMRTMKTQVGDQTALYGLVCGPFTLASHLRGTDIFMDMFDQPDFLHDLLAYSVQVTNRMADYYAEAGMDVIAVVDPLVSQISPRHFSTFLSPAFATVFQYVHQMGVFSSFFVCGDATKNIEVMCQTEPDAISIDENINMVEAKQITDRYNITLGGNLPLTTVMLLGSQQDNMKYALDLLDSLPHRNLIIAPGCDMPYDTPIENVIGVGEAIRNSEHARLLLANYEASARFDIDVQLPDYAHLQKPLVEVFTLDSDSCAACMYMWDAARLAGREMGPQVDVIEYKFTKPENIARCKKLGVKNLPSIYINGDLRFSSIIPSHDKLLEAIQEYL